MSLFSLASFIFALLSGSPLPEQEGYDEMKGEDVGRYRNVCLEQSCQATLSDTPDDDPTDEQLS